MPFLPAIVLAAVLAQDKPAEPDADAQKETLKVVKDLFKDEYAKRSPADQAALAQKLLQKGIEANDDAVSRFVLLKEARDVASAAGDADTAMRAAGEMARDPKAPLVLGAYGSVYHVSKVVLTSVTGLGKKIR